MQNRAIGIRITCVEPLAEAPPGVQWNSNVPQAEVQPGDDGGICDVYFNVPSGSASITSTAPGQTPCTTNVSWDTQGNGAMKNA